MTKDPRFDAEAARQARLATALRQNLLRRKMRDRSEAEARPVQETDQDRPAGDADTSSA